MFENLSDRLQNVIKKIKGYGIITEENINEMLKDIRLALLEADVNYIVVKEFISNVKEKALGEVVRKNLNPGQEFIKIVKNELVNLLGENTFELKLISKPSVVMLVGLQGSGKTTTAGKIANYIRKNNKLKPLLVACDIYRPAAIDQLKEIGKSLNIEIFNKANEKPVEIAKEAILYARDNNYDVVIIDTAGRLHIDKELMNELVNMNIEVKCDEILLVIDAMMGQDAINVINGFNNLLKLTGAIVTKLDGDTKGGVALSLRHLTNVPIKFIGTSEKLDGIDLFHPDRMAQRILGMGDVLSLVEQIENKIDEKEVKIAASKMQKGKFDLEDFLNQLNQIKKLGNIESLLKMVPGINKTAIANVNVDPKDMAHIEAIILSMTKKERRNPDILKATHKIRIAKGSGRNVQEVNRLLNQFEQMKKTMKMYSNGNLKFPK